VSKLKIAGTAVCVIAALVVYAPRAAIAQAPSQSTTLSAPAQATRPIFWVDHTRGWHFYEDPVEPPPPVTPIASSPQASTPSSTSSDPRPPELVEFAQLQKKLEESRQVAIVRPTEANVRRYMELEVQVTRQASHFADVAQRVAWANPELDMTLQGRPTNAQAIQVFDRERQDARTTQVTALSKTHVLLFFFRSDCPYCHALAPILETFETRYGMHIVAISVDGGGLPNFPNFRRDNGIARSLQVTQVPAVFLANPFDGVISPLGFGVLSESQLLERIATVSSPGAGDEVPSSIHQASLE
jgi:conjugal transfer pilus assembly protein TraF